MRFLALPAAALMLQGCATAYTVSSESAPPRPYSGTRYNVAKMGGAASYLTNGALCKDCGADAVIAAGDMPFSLVADTLMLPVVWVGMLTPTRAPEQAPMLELPPALRAEVVDLSPRESAAAE